MLLSIVVPCFNEEEALPIFYDTLQDILENLLRERNINSEFIFIDDGSKDKTLEVIKKLKKKDARIRFVSFSRNFGKEAGLYAGLIAAKGDLIVIMDADLQDPPHLLPEMVSGIVDEGYDCVGTRRVDREGEPPVRSLFARLFYRLINSISETRLVDGARDYRIMNKQMVEAILELGEINRFSKGLFSWVGFRTKWLTYRNISRIAGETKWSFWSLFRYSIEALLSFSTAPLSISSFFGLVFCMISLGMAVFYGIRAIAFGNPVAGFPTLICVILLIGGVQLFCLGILGQYLAKTYLEVKKRPIYIIKESE